MKLASAPTPHDLLPPPDPRSLYRMAWIGIVLCAVSAGIGAATSIMDSERPGLISSGRLLLVAAGTLIAGIAVSRGSHLWRVWMLAALAVLLSVFGIPTHWDSARTLARVTVAITAAGAVLTALPTWVRYSLGSVWAVFHFGGIFTATTMPEPAPWLSNQAFNWVYNPYLTFAYMRNAYHFYSPEPGPASLLVVLVKYETDPIDPKTGKPAIVHEWVSIPDRGVHMRDPLGLTYYRRLALTEMISSSTSAILTPQSAEKAEATRLREKAAFGLHGKEPIPLAPEYLMPVFNQYRVPQAHITRYVLPSYAKHMAVEFTGPGRRVLSTKLYRLEHQVVRTPVFAQGGDPYHPTTYLPFYLGEYDPEGRLTDPQDPMLYWYVPIISRPGGANPTNPAGRDYDDYLSRHAGFAFSLFEKYDAARRHP